MREFSGYENDSRENEHGENKQLSNRGLIPSEIAILKYQLIISQ